MIISEDPSSSIVGEPTQPFTRQIKSITTVYVRRHSEINNEQVYSQYAKFRYKTLLCHMQVIPSPPMGNYMFKISKCNQIYELQKVNL